MASSLRVTNIPRYIAEEEFKRTWNQSGLQVQSCTFNKSATGEIVGLVHFANPQAAGRAREMYEGWQGYGNPDGLRIEFGTDERPGGVKREREDAGGEDQAFKQGRVMGPGNLGYAGGGGIGGYSNPNAQSPAFNSALNPGPNHPIGAGIVPLAAQAGGVNFSGSQPGRPGYMGQPPQGIPSQGVPPHAVSGPLAMQGYNQGASMGLNATSQGLNLNPAQRQGPGQQLYGSQEAGPSGQQNSQYARPQSGLQQPPPQGPQPVGPLAQNSQYPANGPAFPHGPSGPNYGDPQGASQVYDPQHPQLGGGQQPPQQQQQQQLTQPGPQQMASLANVLGPLLQGGGPGLQNLSNVNLGSLLSQGGVQNLPPQQNNLQQQPMQAQMQAVPHAQQPPPQMVGGVPQPQPQVMPMGRPEGMPGGAMEQLPPEAAETLYVDNMTMDVTRREMSHIFRPFEGFKDMRIVEKKDKHGSPLVIGFAEFDTAHQANAALQTLQGYPLDMNKPNESQLRISFAKPLKASDPRSRGQPVNRPYQPAANLTANRINDRGRGDRGGAVGNIAGARNDRDRRDGDRGGPRGQGPDRRDRRPAHEDRRPVQDNRRRY